jgi:hypothetical protein
MSTDGNGHLTKLDREVRRMLLSPAGRASLKKFGIDVDLVKGDEKSSDKPIVAVLCPTYRAPEPQMRDALAGMMGYTHEKGIATVYTGAPVQASVVHWSRNWLLGEQLKSGKPWTHALFIDDDIVVEPDALERLLSHKKDIVAGLCTRRNDPPIPNIRFYDRESGETKQIWEWPENQLVEVDAAGTGLMLLSMHAVEQVAECYFGCVWEQDFYGFAGPRVDEMIKVRREKFDKEKICYWFRFLPTPKGDIEMGEDVCFCFLAKKYCDIPTYVDTSVQPGHLGSYPFSIRDFVPYRDMCVERAKEQGTYKAQPLLQGAIELVG